MNSVSFLLDRPKSELDGAVLVKRTIGPMARAVLYLSVYVSWPVWVLGLLVFVPALYSVSFVITLGRWCRTLSIMHLFTDSLVYMVPLQLVVCIRLIQVLVTRLSVLASVLLIVICLSLVGLGTGLVLVFGTLGVYIAIVGLFALCVRWVTRLV